MAKTTSRGTCALCGYSSTKAGLTRHLKSCPPEHDGSRGQPAKLFHMRVEDAESPLYWLDVEVKQSASLRDLDAFLREVWLECCGHLSLFRIGRAHYHVDDELVEEEETLEDFAEMFPSANRAALEGLWANRPVERSMDARLGEVLSPGLKFEHEYDFGSTTYLKLKVVGEREGRIGRAPIRLLARNDPPTWDCGVCGAPATQVNTEALWEEGNPFYCEAHTAEHEDDWAFLPVVNSPRMGVCGYTGPEAG